MLQAHVGIDAGGKGHRRGWHHEPRAPALRVARFAAGARRGRGLSSRRRRSSSVAAVAVAPGGEHADRLGERDRRARHRRRWRAAAPRRVQPSTSHALSASLADDGSAAARLSARRRRGRDRRAGSAAPWQAPRVLWSSGATRYRGSSSDRTSQRVLDDDHAGRSRRGGLVRGRRRRPAGLRRARPDRRARGRPRCGSRRSRGAAYLTSLAPDAAGVPRALWSESELGVARRDPRPGAHATSPRPEVTARFPPGCRARGRPGHDHRARALLGGLRRSALHRAAPRRRAVRRRRLRQRRPGARAPARTASSALRLARRSRASWSATRRPGGCTCACSSPTARATSSAARGSVRVRVIEKPIRAAQGRRRPRLRHEDRGRQPRSSSRWSTT